MANDQNGTTPLQLALAWGFVGIPLIWGVLQTLSNALKTVPVAGTFPATKTSSPGGLPPGPFVVDAGERGALG